MAYFPFMVDISGMSCLVAGGGSVAAGKAETMLEFGAQVTLVAPEITEEIQGLARRNHGLALEHRKVKETDIVAADIAILATDDAVVNARMAAVARKHKILVNVVDKKEDCGFYFPAILRQRDVVVAVSTGGKSPLLAAQIKKEIAKNLRDDYGDIAEEMGRRRGQVLEQIPDEAKRREVFEEMLKKELDENAESENPHRHQGE